MKVLKLTTGPAATNVWVVADVRTREAIAIDMATPSVRWLTQQLGDEGWALRFIVSTHRHWDHIGDNAEAVIATGATLAGTSDTFTWDGSGVNMWWLYVGSNVGRADYYNSGNLQAATGVTASGLPGGGVPVFGRLWYKGC